jgi:SAM-dependent methyltransferase
MNDGSALRPPEVPADYYDRMAQIDRTHWWHRGMRSIASGLLGDRLERDGQSLLDAGCGTGGFLLWARGLGSFDRLCGVDLSSEAIAFTGEAVPEADLHLAPLRDVPYEDGSFDLVVCNDVLQHVGEADLQPSLTELRRVLRRGGALLVRTNGARHGWREGPEWRAYDPPALRADLENAGFACERLTFVNMLGSAWASLRGNGPRGPSDVHHGLPALDDSRPGDLRLRVLEAEARFLSRPGRRLPYGHTLLAVATPR